ncbi:hypothetical protein BSL78_00596 [Apostichopus japonicus]|uniref:Reverse transcriptase domain-containing protein n=1 Tax=Stichopus japonicus TaxID=307972 RepID=A0A2G8LQG1_STIJA|nr:hypothetical protein BSL78_00596 [Apostichopus japonicus]
MDAMAITETWLKGDDSDDCILADLHTSLPDFAFYHCPRNKGKGGGVGFLIRKGFDVKLNDSGNLRSFEFIDLNISSSKSTIRMIGLYRPPPNNKNKLTFAMFIDDFSSLLQFLSSSTTPLIIMGDFNIHVDVPSDQNFASFDDLLQAFDFQQHVSGPTHRNGHTIDLIISHKDSDLVKCTCVHDEHLCTSDHSVVSCLINLDRPPPVRKFTQRRNLKNIDFDQFRCDIGSSSLLLNPQSSLDSLVDQYYSVLRTIIDKHAPVTRKAVIMRPRTKWYSRDIRLAKREKRKCERKYKHSGLIVHKQLYMTQCQLPCSLKQAVIIPHIKKPKLDANNLANYRPISNLPYLSKLIERIVCKQFQDYLSNNDLYAKMQSAYRANYSTETAQLYVQNSLLCALDERKDALLVLLDFSSAFDTINHQTLLTRLHERYGVDGIPLYWLKSYLANRTQCVIVDQNLSKDVTLATGVPQGSVLGPLLYTLYVAPLHDLIISANMQTVIYADDIQLFTSFHPDHCSDAIQKIQNCIADVKSWAISTIFLSMTQRLKSSMLPRNLNPQQSNLFQSKLIRLPSLRPRTSKV